MKKFTTLLSIFQFLLLLNLSAQQTLIKGFVKEADTQRRLPGVQVQLKGTTTISYSDPNGYFEIAVPAKFDPVLVFQMDEFSLVEKKILLKGRSIVDVGIFNLTPNLESGQNAIPTITLNSAEMTAEEDIEDISGLLTASSDIFASVVRFPFFAARYNIKGYSSDHSAFHLNGIPMNSLENGWVYWEAWSGLNDVTRNQYSNLGFGLSPMPFAFGELGGASNIDIRASAQRKQTRFSYSNSNRSYSHRIMATHSTGELRNGWAFSFSGSRRWAQEGYLPGSFYDAWSYFLGVDKKLSDQHRLSLNVLGTPIRRGRAGASTQEMYDLAGTNYYNPYWGYQNGEKRNSRVAYKNQPLFILNHDWKINDKANLSTSASFRFGRNGSTALDWYRARDPRPDYYRRLPSYVQDPGVAAQVADAISNDENLRQIDWDYFYQVNRNSPYTATNVGGQEGNEVSGNLSKYILEERRYDSQEANLNIIYEQNISDFLTLNGGLSYQQYDGENYRIVDDLLGGDFYLDLDRFAERDLPGDSDAQQNDLDNPNRVLYEGDVFGHSYDVNIRKSRAWLQGQFSFRKIDFFLAGNVSHTTFWRTGNMRNGKFPENSLGDSEKANFNNYGVKAGLTYKIDGRNYIYASAYRATRAPFFRHSFVSPRTRNQLLPGLDNETIQSGEFGYNIRSPYFKARIGGYYTQFRNRVWSRSFYHDEERSFVNYVMQGLDWRHMGLEAAFEAKLGAAFSVNGAASMGDYIINSRPNAIISQDNNAQLLVQNRTLYLKNFFLSGTPQTAGTIGLKYSSPKYWFASINFNYFDDIWIDVNPDRRTAAAVEGIEQGSDLWQSVLWQEQAPSAFTLDIFGGGSIKLNNYFKKMEKNYFISYTIGVNNILNNQNFITNGFEQFRFDYQDKDVNRFPSRYYYGYGLNYFVNLSFRFY